MEMSINIMDIYVQFMKIGYFFNFIYDIRG